MGCVLHASGLICVLVWGSFSSPGAGGLFHGCHMAARPCPHVSMETPPPYVGFSSRSPSVQLSIPRKGVGGREMTRAPPRGPSRSAGIPPRRRKEGGKMGRPRREGDGHQRKGGGERRGAENSHPHQEMVVVRGQEGSKTIVDDWLFSRHVHGRADRLCGRGQFVVTVCPQRSGVWRLLFSQVYVCAANAKNLRRRWPVVVAPEMGRSLGRTAGGTDYRCANTRRDKIFVQ